MHVVKVETTTINKVYLNLETISYFYYNSNLNTTVIKMITGELFDIEGDFSGKLAKLITTSTSGSSLILE